MMEFGHGKAFRALEELTEGPPGRPYGPMMHPPMMHPMPEPAVEAPVLLTRRRLQEDS